MSLQLITKHDAGLTALHSAAARGDIEEVKRALSNGHSVHEVDKYMGAAPLHYAAQSGSVAVIEMLLAAGAHLNLQAHSHGMTPLMVAVWHRNPGAVARLLQRPNIDVQVRARTGATAESLIGGGFEESRLDQEIREHFEKWHRRQPDLPIISVLENAELSKSEKASRIQDLLNHGANPNETAGFSNMNNPGHSALLIAARDGHTRVVESLLAAGADITLVGAFMLAHPGHKAGYMGHPGVMRILTAHPDFPKIANAQGPFNGYTALHDAAWHGHAETADVLLNAGVRTDLKGYDGRTPAQLARHGGYFETARKIDAVEADA